MKLPTVKQAMERAERKKFDLPRIVQVYPSDWDTVILAKEIKRLRKRIAAKQP